MTPKKIIIAIDGVSSSGKSTAAKDVARELGYTYIDSGAMYRAITLYCIRENLIHQGLVDEKTLKDRIPDIRIEFVFNELTSRSDTYLNGEKVEDEIRNPDVAALVSPVSKIGFVREAMVTLQRELGQEKGIVMDGRDIGTVVFPDAEVKIFLTASPEVRAERRYKELKIKGLDVNYDDILSNLQERDRIDSTREISPLRKADDAIELDNSGMTLEEQKAFILEQVEAWRQRTIQP
ncbi:MAG: (d)CMP kinase [Bacteroidales bacterium]|nr:(d)CMP kinase [Bacteroidales bacterium]MDD3385571.1 (d)CMP kinase [Bacteroidales bacterium]MDD3811601.1 (d)CMP kinase [Bacteroidales bacterium]MDD4812203.1 (d)CMP kinase [Bacteroidales bacterium]